MVCVAVETLHCNVSTTPACKRMDKFYAGLELLMPSLLPSSKFTFNVDRIKKSVKKSAFHNNLAASCDFVPALLDF